MRACDDSLPRASAYKKSNLLVHNRCTLKKLYKPVKSKNDRDYIAISNFLYSGLCCGAANQLFDKYTFITTMPLPLCPVHVSAENRSTARYVDTRYFLIIGEFDLYKENTSIDIMGILTYYSIAKGWLDVFFLACAPPYQHSEWRKLVNQNMQAPLASCNKRSRWVVISMD